jgi:hypothetical protein
MAERLALSCVAACEPQYLICATSPGSVKLWHQLVTRGRLDRMAVERCEECGYDGDDWTDSSAVTAIERLPARWHEALAGLTSGELHRRPIPSMWSIAEYADHVREVFFGMHFLLDTAVTTPGADLGESPSPPFDPEPRRIEVEMALAGIEREATALRERLNQLTPDQWDLAVELDGDDVNPHWITRHVVHDATHHLGDVAHLRAAL